MKIDVSPTKDFFISIITRDISLLDAVKDLVDNCADGARRTRPDGNYTGLKVDIEVTADHFAIIDNCGGIPVDIARDYAFRFGKPEGAPTLEGSIGQFGVGMKRALFKMGSNFEIDSKSANSNFNLVVDVNEWRTLKDENGRDLWEFEFASAVEGMNNAQDACGTTLVVTGLYKGVSSEFKSDTFKSRLIKELQEAHAETMEKGLDIQVNKFELQHRMATLLMSNEIRPIKIEREFPSNPEQGIRDLVRLTIYAGIGESNLDAAGWYIYCNGRQIVHADKTGLTGWASIFEDIKTPKAHAQFARFRGYAIFESDDAGSLPWNTQKSWVNDDSSVYQWALREMGPALRQVIDFLNALDSEGDTESTHLRDAVQAAELTNLPKIPASNAFQYPKVTVQAPKTVRIQFSKPVAEVEFAKKFFRVGSAGKAGEEAFDYFMEREDA